jgi:hypothetical protein
MNAPLASRQFRSAINVTTPQINYCSGSGTGTSITKIVPNGR